MSELKRQSDTLNGWYILKQISTALLFNAIEKDCRDGCTNDMNGRPQKCQYRNEYARDETQQSGLVNAETQGTCYLDSYSARHKAWVSSTKSSSGTIGRQRNYCIHRPHFHTSSSNMGKECGSNINRSSHDMSMN